MSTPQHHARKAVLEARIWRDESLPAGERRRARRRFRYALKRAAETHPLGRLYLHLSFVALADSGKPIDELFEGGG